MANVQTKYATAITQSGTAWTTISNAAGAPDGTLATDNGIGPGGGGHTATPLYGKGFGFTIPSNAIILGIQLEGVVSGYGGSHDIDVYLVYGASSTTAIADTPNYGQFWTSLIAHQWGSATTLWGRTWTPAEVNSANFGASLSAFPNSGTAATNVDSFKINVYWDYPPLANGTIQKTYLYQVFRQGQFLGLLPKVLSEFQYTQDINTAGAQLSISCGVSADTSGLDAPTIDDETGVPIQTETGSNLTTEKYPDVVGNSNSGALFRNGNQIIVYEISNYRPLRHRTLLTNAVRRH